MPATGHRHHVHYNGTEYPARYVNLDRAACARADCTREHKWVYDEPRPDPHNVIAGTIAALNEPSDRDGITERIIEWAMGQPVITGHVDLRFLDEPDSIIAAAMDGPDPELPTGGSVQPKSG